MYSKILFIALSCLVAGIIAAPTNVPPEILQPAVIPIVSQSEEIHSNGSYKFSFETGNGIIREEVAYDKLQPKLRDASSDEGGESNESEEIHVQRGSYSYTAPDGTIISVRYIADENGFQPIYETIPQGNAKSVDKSGRALKLDTSETSVGLVPRIGSLQFIESKSAKKPTPEVASEASSAPAIVPENAPVPEPVPEKVSAAIPEVAFASIPQESPVVNPEPSAVSETVPSVVPEAIPSGLSESAPAAVPESAPVPESISAEASTIANEALTASIGKSQSITESGDAEANVSTIPNIDVSTEVASSVVPDQPSTEPEQRPTTALEQSSSSEVVESSSSTSAPEQSSAAEVDGQQAFEESVASSPAEEVEKPATNASEPVTPEE